jgi:hypothetical protein
VTILILLILVVLLWVAVLAPSAWRHFGERQGVGSIDHFHHQLQLLEHAGPKTVAPAYRLHTAVPGRGVVPDPGVPHADSSRPKLVLLRPTDDQKTADVDGSDGVHYERVGVLDRPEPVCLPEATAELGHYRRAQARNRCTVFLRVLCGVALSTGLIGLFPGMHLIWVVTVLSGLAALGLLGLIGYAKELEAQRRQQQKRRAETQRFADPGASGSPASWDDEAYQAAEAAAY